MQITEEGQAEIMEILADDQMKHAEAPSEEEIDAMHRFITQADIDEANRLSAEYEAWHQQIHQHDYCDEYSGIGCKSCRDQWDAKRNRRRNAHYQFPVANNVARLTTPMPSHWHNNPNHQG